MLARISLRTVPALLTITVAWFWSESANSVTFTNIVDTNTNVHCQAVSADTYTDFEEASLANNTIIFHGVFGMFNNFESIVKRDLGGNSETLVSNRTTCSPLTPSSIGVFSFDGEYIAFDAIVPGHPGVSLVQQIGHWLTTSYWIATTTCPPT